MGISQKRITAKQEAIMVIIIIAATSSIVIVTSDRTLQQEVRKESLATTGMQPDNTATAGTPSPPTNIIKILD